jgi:hypothetical protein
MKLDGVDGLTVTLKMSGELMQEYNDNADELYVPTIDRSYVQAIAGETFSVHLLAKKGVLVPPNPLDYLVMNVYLDGKRADGRVLSINALLSDYHFALEGISENQGAGGYFMKPFTFAALHTSKAV